MEMAGLCSICGRPGAMYTCHLCGRMVCPQHYDAAHGVCTACAQGKR